MRVVNERLEARIWLYPNYGVTLSTKVLFVYPEATPDTKVQKGLDRCRLGRSFGVQMVDRWNAGVSRQRMVESADDNQKSGRCPALTI